MTIIVKVLDSINTWHYNRCCWILIIREQILSNFTILLTLTAADIWEVKATQRQVDVTSTDEEVCHSLRLFLLTRILDI
jgi:hypothetical protein